MKQGNLNIRCTEDYAVLYWDKPAAAPSGAEYTVSLNGEAIGRTDRTHFTIEWLSYGQRQLLHRLGHAAVRQGKAPHRHYRRALLLQGRRPYPEHRQFTAGHQRLRRGRYSVRAGGRFPDRRTAAAQRSGNLSGQGRGPAGHNEHSRLFAPHPQPV